ncbi:MAG: hypothetical protein K0R12_1297, partial [Gammaproteobacteria bacterium]|nr:hypothetical protein [Gammaproteobacteria bacterium]
MYLCFSTLIEPDVMEYIDSNKVGVKVGSAPGEAMAPKGYYVIFRK